MGLWLMVAVVLLVPAAVQAAPAKRYLLRRGHCRSHYLERREKVRRHERGKVRLVTVTFCVRAKAKKTPAQTPHAMPVTPSPTTRTVALQSHLDPSFVQSPSNPLAVIYSYSASATTTNPATGTTTAEPNLPGGFLDLYSDGLLACSINVGGSTTGGECPVTYSTTGVHQVIVTYSSGSLSATETYREQIEPYSTVVHLTYKYAAAEAGEWHLELSTSLTDAYGSVAFHAAPEECEIPTGPVEPACPIPSSAGPSLPPECSTELTDTQTGKQIATGSPSLDKRLKLIDGEADLEWNPGDTNSFVVPAKAVEEGLIVAQASCTSADGFAGSSSAAVPLVLDRS